MQVIGAQSECPSVVDDIVHCLVHCVIQANPNLRPHVMPQKMSLIFQVVVILLIYGYRIFADMHNGNFTWPITTTLCKCAFENHSQTYNSHSTHHSLVPKACNDTVRLLGSRTSMLSFLQRWTELASSQYPERIQWFVL